MQILRATHDDIDELLSLQREAFTPRAMELDWPDAFPLNESRESAEEEFGRCVTLKLVIDGRIVGSVRGESQNKGKDLYVSRLMVHPSCCRQGYGRRLMEQILEEVPHRRAWLYVWDQEPDAVRRYEQLGYRVYGSEPAPRETRWLLMERMEER